MCSSMPATHGHPESKCPHEQTGTPCHSSSAGTHLQAHVQHVGVGGKNRLRGGLINRRIRHAQPLKLGVLDIGHSVPPLGGAAAAGTAAAAHAAGGGWAPLLRKGAGSRAARSSQACHLRPAAINATDYPATTLAPCTATLSLTGTHQHSAHNHLSRTCARTFMPSAAPTARSHDAKPNERRRGKPAPASASSVLSVPAMGLLRVEIGSAACQAWLSGVARRQPSGACATIHHTNPGGSAAADNPQFQQATTPPNERT